MAASISLYFLAVVAFWLLLRVAGDRWWLPTLLMFGPRWICLLPLVVLAPMAAFGQRRLLWVLGAIGLILVFPVLGLCIPWARATPIEGQRLRVMTLNVGSNAVDPEALRTLIAQVSPDVIALQECNHDSFVEVFASWHVVKQGELLVAAKFPLETSGRCTAVEPPHTHARTVALKCVANCSWGEIALGNVHLPSPSYGLYAVLDSKTIVAPSRRGVLEQGIAIRSAVSISVAQSMAAVEPDSIVLGDFNMPVDSAIYRRDWSHFTNAFSTTGWGFGHTVRGSRRGLASSARIDHVLVGADWAPLRCWVGPNLGSDHLPVIADLVWQGRPNSDE